MIHFEDFPYAPFREAMNTIAGRLATVFAAMVVGSLLASFTATESWSDMLSNLPPVVWFVSLFSGHGFIVFPGIIVFSTLFVRMQWPLPLVLLVAAVMWWDGHGAIRWSMYDSPLVKKLHELRMPEIPGRPNPER